MPEDAKVLTAEELQAYYAASGEAPLEVDPTTDGEVVAYIDQNGDLMVECQTSFRFRKYPYPATSV